jgi:hypothetical protein
LAHLRENVRVTLMWCAYTGPPAVVRIRGHGEPVFRDDPSWSGLIGRFGDADAPGVRAIIRVVAQRISDTRRLAVQFMGYRGERSLHSDYFGRKTDERFAGYCASKPYNALSIDGLPALPLPLLPRSR